MYLRYHDALIVAKRPAVFLAWKWKGRIYADILYTDNNERGTCHIMDLEPAPLSQEYGDECPSAAH